MGATTTTAGMTKRRFPAEWEAHESTLLTWPHDPEIWGEAYHEILPDYARFVARVLEDEPVDLVVPSASCGQQARELVERFKRSEFPPFLLRTFVIESDDAWVRDHGPTVVFEGDERIAQCWRFNAWGGKFPHQRDARVATRFAAQRGLKAQRHAFILEGGALETNGCGDLLVTEAVQLNVNRNKVVSKEAQERFFRRTLGVSRIHWLNRGLEGDDTDGHIDDVARFCDEKTIVMVSPEDPQHPDYATMRENWERLKGALGADGRPFKLVALPCPDPVCVDGELLPASYANFYITNQSVIVPQFSVPQDQLAIDILAELFPKRRVEGLPAQRLLSQGGSFHCLSQQLPKAPAL